MLLHIPSSQSDLHAGVVIDSVDQGAQKVTASKVDHRKKCLLPLSALAPDWIFFSVIGAFSNYLIKLVQYLSNKSGVD
ncbi:hypothetical protein COEREDRAFT_91608 [Coemansia reversa NRRL 1564]|uniref:Uncharacterized protein n=1 Tax=Coemansia reversa (strain ATCC 12441 / NRRL 1564) TaxID=763665 RepID=A0A2G5BFY0_COERN|nr:hypothetical protein COEREDRAFT_91608 [Coemansia reversa NRRL 1564]|eukprot:PIA17919.1 hypothetical protein COEREDRAFT_91608 [Coemansia reversa NRRL 1564]